MLSFRNTLRENDPEVIAQIASSTGFFDDKDIKLRISDDSEGIYFEIEDYGVGIENIAKAREVLFSTMKSKDRSGLGFTIMELFSTKFDVVSTPGEGTLLKIFKAWE